jgi:hypothetical protein
MENQYQIVTATSPSELSRKVGQLISEGWVRQGSHMAVVLNESARISGGIITGNNYAYEYSQTMVKTHTPDETSTRQLGDYTDKDLFARGQALGSLLSGNPIKLKEGFLYKFSYDFNGPQMGLGRYVAETDTLYFIYLDKDGGVGMETPSKITNLKVLDIVLVLG